MSRPHQRAEQRQRYKIVTVGDGCCGKTSLQVRYVYDDFSHQCVPTVFEAYPTEISIDGETLELSLWDTSGQEEYDRLRPLSYRSTDVAIICFSVESHTSLLNVKKTWYPEVRYFCPNTPIVLVANKIDLRHDRATLDALEALNSRPISSEDGAEMSRKIRAYAYCECSALTRAGICDVFDTAARAAMQARNLLGCALL